MPGLAIVVAWFVSSAAVALGVAAACDTLFGTFSIAPWRAPVRASRSRASRSEARDAPAQVQHVQEEEKNA